MALSHAQPFVVAGVDIGGTKTHLRIVRDDRLVAETITSTDEWRSRAWDADAQALIGLIHRAAAGVRPSTTIVGAHGCDSTDECLAFQAAISRCTDADVVVLNDAELLLGIDEQRADEPGIAVICGTGSIAVTRSPDGRLLTAGGWGWLLGDEGSASGLVRDAAKALRRHLDRGGTDDGLGGHLLQSLELRDPIGLGQALVRKGSAAEIGRHAPAVFAAADDGSQLARDVVMDSARALVGLVTTLIERGAPGRRIVLGGSVIVRQARLLQAFEAEAEHLLPETKVELASEPPVAGAVNLARRRAVAGTSRVADAGLAPTAIGSNASEGRR